jgi:hypothetical protein
MVNRTTLLFKRGAGGEFKKLGTIDFQINNYKIESLTPLLSITLS